MVDFEKNGADSNTPRGDAADQHVLVFSYGQVLFAVPARVAETVIRWQDPMPLPGASAAFMGVVQNRGRIVTVMRHPAGTSGQEMPALTRIIVCATPRGHLGLPASGTRGVIEVAGVALKPSAVFDSTFGPVTFVAPDEIVHRLTGVAEGAHART